jgi:hypothetical protein
MNGLLDKEGSQICCLLNLGATVQKNYSNPPARYLDRSTDPSQYISMLRGNGSPDAWLYLVDRYVFASDVGEWCIYCEKENDVGVIAFSGEVGTNKFSSALGKLQATSINSAREMPREGAFYGEGQPDQRYSGNGLPISPEEAHPPMGGGGQQLPPIITRFGGAVGGIIGAMWPTPAY